MWSEARHLNASTPQRGISTHLDANVIANVIAKVTVSIWGMGAGIVLPRKSDDHNDAGSWVRRAPPA
jgi:hypothetical protein